MVTFGSDIHKENIDSSAQFTGQCLIEGALTRIGPGVRIENSCLQNVVVEPAAHIVDSVITGSASSRIQHVPKGFSKKWAVDKKFPNSVGECAELRGCTIRFSSIGARTRCTNVFIGDSTIGADNTLLDVYAYDMQSQPHVHVQGPTEIAEAWLGHHTFIDKCGFFVGAFTNDFYVLEFDKTKGVLDVKEIIDVPHTSRFGMNVINSTNSGRLLERPDGCLKSLGRYGGLWYDELLSQDPIIIGPCCWVAGWTKIVGHSARVHNSAAELLMDSLATNLLPFSASGLNGSAASGQIMPGELFDGLMYKQRHPAWAFTYAPGAVIAMVQRVAEAMGDTAVADRLVDLALRSALALVYCGAAQRGINIDAQPAAASRGWTGWFVNAARVLRRHIDSGLWEFSRGEPCNWRIMNGKWTPKDQASLTAIAEDALENQIREDTLTACEQQPLSRTLGIRENELLFLDKETFIDPGAEVSPRAYIGPGVQIRGKSVVEEGARLFRAIIDNSTVGKNVRLARAYVEKSNIGADADVSSASLVRSSLTGGSSAHCTRLLDATVDGVARISPYACIENTVIRHPCIVGSTIKNSTVDSIFMSYHMPGQVEYLEVEKCVIMKNGGRETIHAIPMLGGGLRIQGRADAPVRSACAFIGSNAILEAGAYVGFGSFVLGTLTGEEGLPPFTISVSAGPVQDEIGMVVHRFAGLVITHFINWAFQALGPDSAESVGLLVPSMLCEGRDAVRWAIGLREAGRPFDESSPYAKYRSLKLYTDSQLKSGLEAYEFALSDDRWKMAFTDGELRFTGNGYWSVSEGAARWKSEMEGSA